MKNKLLEILIKVFLSVGFENPEELFKDSYFTDNCISTDNSINRRDLYHTLAFDPDDSTQRDQKFNSFAKMNQKKSKNMDMLKLFLQEDPSNPYFKFLINIESYPLGINTHVHHIIPKYLFKNEYDYVYNSDFNLIVLSLEDHIKAHELLFQLYKDEKDRGAVLLLKGNRTEAVKIWKQAGARVTNAKMRLERKTMFDTVWQAEMAQRSLARPDALEIRSRGGTLGGRNRNIGRAVCSKDRYVFLRDGEEYMCTFNCSTGGDVLRELNKAVPTKLQRVTPLLNGSRKNLHGWSCKKLT
jgi:hypothetical protein